MDSMMQLELTFGDPLERCAVCLAMHPAPGWLFIHRKRFAPCSWCGTDWREADTVEPFTSRQRARLHALGWSWRGAGRSTELAPAGAA